MKLSHSYKELGPAFSQSLAPTPVSNPHVLLWNDRLAEHLQLDDVLRKDPSMQSAYFSGNELPELAEPIALAYAGHQFGHFNPQLGDGRAHLLGEIINSKNVLQDIQLKGSGPTQFSRQGDGRCALGPALREYLMSEAMYALGVPTTRSLAVVATGDQIYRDKRLPGAIVTRVASSHIRVGTFQYFAARQDLQSLKQLADYAIARHFPDIDKSSETKYVQFLDLVIERQIKLVIEWMRVGFIHGVMNTDNTAISGETIDYGPCAMMDTFDTSAVFSSIDAQRRYAFGNQPSIVHWNMTRLAECLIPLINEDSNQAIAQLEPVVQGFAKRFEMAYLTMMGQKLGAQQSGVFSSEFIQQFLENLQEKKLDYTQTFLSLSNSFDDQHAADELHSKMGDQFAGWQDCLRRNNVADATAKKQMEKANPLVIPRNHHVENVLQQVESGSDLEHLERFLKVLRSPYTMLPETAEFQKNPVNADPEYRTFCGT